MPSAVPLARVVRSGLEESLHLGHVAVCDTKGRLTAWAGDPRRVVFARSSMKPLQASVSLSAMRDELPDDLVAVMCASHNGEPIHVRTVRRLLRWAGLGPAALRNPRGWPLDARSMARARRPTRLLHNCSGKHAGMLAACVGAGWDLETYRRPSHPLQRRILRAILRGSGLAEVRVGVDGCGVPVHGMPLSAIATLYARLGQPERFVQLEPWVTSAVRAMHSRPYLVAGRGRTDTALMRVARGVVVKGGAEALHCAAIPQVGLGIAVKVLDGGERASGPALIRTLSLLGVLDGEQLDRLEPFAERAVTGGDERVGSIEAVLDLHRR